jgi:predicted CXXCH cytochrome family protein
MKVLIRTWTRQGGERSAQDRVIEVGRLHIGRGTEQDIEIPDLRVGLTYAEIISEGKRGRFTIQAKNTPAIWVNEDPVERRNLNSGDSIDCGRFRLTVGKAPDEVDLLIEVEERMSAREEKARRLAGLSTTLTGAGLSRRRLSWLLFIAVIGLTLVLPYYFRFHSPYAAGLPPPAYAWPRDTAWTPGPLSPAHSLLENDCGKCHEQPFVHVRNEACLACHKKVHEHVDDAHWAAMPAFAQSRCEDCHMEHQGKSLVDTHNQLCTQCHTNPQQQFPGIKLEAADSFSSRHPNFHPMVSRFDASASQFKWIAVDQAQTTELHNDTHLIYPHDKHLDPAGIKSPTGKRVLKCADCHESDGTGVSFKPVQMEKHCAECHRLDFDPDDPDRVLPHGNVALVAQTIRDYYGRAALTGGVTKPGAPEIVRLVRKPGEQLTKPQAQIALAWADQQSALVIDEVFDKRICGYCHRVSKTGDAALPFSIAPVALQDHGTVFPHAEFSHAAHATEKCTSCHAAETSKHAEDVLMPDIQRCRDCHADVGGKNKMTSPCSECHRYHMAKDRLMLKTGEAGNATPVMKAAGGKP